MSESKQGRENRRVKRIRLKTPLKVFINSIGSQMSYELETIDVSDNGFFLSHESPKRFPFSPASILEVRMDLSQKSDDSIFFNGKIARVVYPKDPLANDTGPGIAIRIAQITTENENKLRLFLNNYDGEPSMDGPGNDKQGVA